jgi:hypothetical protein
MDIILLFHGLGLLLVMECHAFFGGPLSVWRLFMFNRVSCYSWRVHLLKGDGCN